ncbi:MAG: hypothetical protein EOO61_11730 [Hymenobacter sp.]|nr:MAG: hypothetical protein EOO61_11730 [Hymenobacter sp.]
MKIQDLDLSAALTGFHELSLNASTVYCDGRNYIPPGLSDFQVNEVYLFKEMNEQKLATGMQYFVAFVQALQQVQLKYRQSVFTLVSVLPGKITSTDGVTENTITRISYTAVA